MRQWLNFHCEGTSLTGALDAADRSTGLLIVSGGNEIASGAHAGMAQLASEIAAHGFPVFRFDRRGIGDSAGENRGYAASAADMAAAARAFRAAAPALQRMVMFGNCDAATALGLFHRELGADALVLANPWLFNTETDLPPPAAIRTRYLRKLRAPREWGRLLRGDVDIGKLFKGLSAMSAPSKEIDVAKQLSEALASTSLPVHVILARHDATALAFSARWHSREFAAVRSTPRITLAEIDTRSHSFASSADADALRAQLIAALEAASGGL